ncbi:MAG: FAD:protein FMN transferase [Gammaproteobacteria bacterium]
MRSVFRRAGYVLIYLILTSCDGHAVMDSAMDSTATEALVSVADLSPEHDTARIDSEGWRFTGSTMGTSYTVKVFPSAPSSVSKNESSVSKNELAQRITDRLERVNALMSTYQPDSEISQFNRMGVDQPINLSRETYAVLTVSKLVSVMSGGRFDVTVGPLVELWGFGNQGRRETLPSDSEIEARRQGIGFTSLTLQSVTIDSAHVQYQLSKSKPVSVDLSAIAKGFGVDQVVGLLRHLGFTRFMVEVGGEVFASGVKPNGEPWRIAVESPTAGVRRVQRIVALQDTAVATSGDYRNFFEYNGKRYSHTIDPSTGRPVTHHLVSTTVMAPAKLKLSELEWPGLKQPGLNQPGLNQQTLKLLESEWSFHTAWADAWATALLVAGPIEGPKLAERYGLPVIFIARDDAGAYTETITPQARDYIQHH